MASEDPRHQALIASLKLRFAEAVRQRDAAAKQALFKEAVYLGIQPELLQLPGEVGSDPGRGDAG
ncbi:MAG: hypothetical protein WAM11_10745 [Cyanobium sp.]